MDAVETFYENSREAVARLGGDEPSLKNAIEASLSKGLVIAAASAFERALAGHIEALYRLHLDTAPALANFAANKAIKRQYHSYFKWEDNNANNFFGLFGPEFANEMKNRVKDSASLNDSVRAFLRLGDLRNQLAHQDYAAFTLEMNLDEVYRLYQNGLGFVAALQTALV